MPPGSRQWPRNPATRQARSHGEGTESLGIAGDDKPALRTIESRMTDNMRFTPDRIQLRQGEAVRFVVRDEGKMLHEMVIGSKEHLDEHAPLMLKFPDRSEPST